MTEVLCGRCSHPPPAHPGRGPCRATVYEYGVVKYTKVTGSTDSDLALGYTYPCPCSLFETSTDAG